MARKPNDNDPTPLGKVLTFQAHEFGFLKRNKPGPSGKLGGYPRHENWLIDNTDQVTFKVVLNPVKLARTIEYSQPHYGRGGPNSRIRAACIPALRRIGIDLLPEWRAPP
jgi:hypothetical protein